MNRAVVPAHILTSLRFVSGNPAAVDLAAIKTETVRKAIHFLIALSPGMAAVNHAFTIGLLMAGILFYVCVECFRLAGVQVPLVSRITKLASRGRDDNRFVLGPVTLGIGALLALLFYPAPASAIAIYALAFGDGFASLAGKLYGNIRPSFMMGKSIEGSTACFIAVLASAFLVSHSFPTAIVAAIVGTVVEALPLEDYDNIALPVSVGLVVQFIPL
ncbi:MAG: phosphatidate cytidylyltransferase [Treponema sp.]|jgi:dolichol kinase|nr:phosphatidate cytidylyltransferase [Treponema sp.]